MNPTGEEIMKFLTHPWINGDTNCWGVIEMGGGKHSVFDGRMFAMPFENEQPEDKTSRINWNYRMSKDRWRGINMTKEDAMKLVGELDKKYE